MKPGTDSSEWRRALRGVTQQSSPNKTHEKLCATVAARQKGGKPRISAGRWNGKAPPEEGAKIRKGL